MRTPTENYWLFFSQCILCRSPTKNSRGICPDCQRDLPWIDTCCPRCALPQTHNHLCPQCSKDRIPFGQVHALFDYQFPINELVAQIKYHDKPVYMAALAELMARHLRYIKPERKPDLLIPVPMHNKRLRQRGYNQAEILARLLGRLLDIPVRSDLLSKNQATAQQMALHRRERQKNLRGAFNCKPYVAHHVALIDDVMTTGTTVSEICKVLRQSSSQTIDVWVLVRTAEDR